MQLAIFKPFVAHKPRHMLAVKAIPTQKEPAKERNNQMEIKEQNFGVTFNSSKIFPRCCSSHISNAIKRLSRRATQGNMIDSTLSMPTV
jgi:hypothetical protein